MKAYGMTLLLKDDAPTIARYRYYHQHPWQECVQGLRDVGITELRIFLIGRRLFMYMVAPDDFDPARDFAKTDEVPRCREWSDLMRSMQEPAPEAKSGDWWATMEEIFDLNRA
jgi:L-rhamnose mutarotase